MHTTTAYTAGDRSDTVRGSVSSCTASAARHSGTTTRSARAATPQRNRDASDRRVRAGTPNTTRCTSIESGMKEPIASILAADATAFATASSNCSAPAAVSARS